MAASKSWWPLRKVERRVRCDDGYLVDVLECGHLRDAVVMVLDEDGQVKPGGVRARRRRCEACGLASKMVEASAASS